MPSQNARSQSARLGVASAGRAAGAAACYIGNLKFGIEEQKCPWRQFGQGPVSPKLIPSVLTHSDHDIDTFHSGVLNGLWAQGISERENPEPCVTGLSFFCVLYSPTDKAARHRRAADDCTLSPAVPAITMCSFSES